MACKNSTGASAGIGKATARHFAASGANLVRSMIENILGYRKIPFSRLTPHSFLQILVARRIESLNDLKAELESQHSVKVHIAKLDVSDPAACDAFFESLPAELRDNVDILVNNAAAWTIPGPVIDANWAEFGAILDTNIKAVVKMIKLFVPGMLKRNQGHIINVGSIVGKESGANGSIYSGSKFFVEAITASLRAEVVATPLRVSLISPGFVKTDFIPVYFPENTEAVEKAFYQGFDPLLAVDIADGITYIASRPPHVQVVDLIVYPTAQASINSLHRKAE